RHTRFSRDWSSDVCSSDLEADADAALQLVGIEVLAARVDRQAVGRDVLGRGGGVLFAHAAAPSRTGAKINPAGQSGGGASLGIRSEERRVGKEREFGGRGD